jgi:hypothetical protein
LDKYSFIFSWFVFSISLFNSSTSSFKVLNPSIFSLFTYLSNIVPILVFKILITFVASFNFINLSIFLLFKSGLYEEYLFEIFSENIWNILDSNYFKFSSFLISQDIFGLIFFIQLLIFFFLWFLLQIYFLYSLLIYNLTFAWNLLFIFLIMLSWENLSCIPFKDESFFILPILLFNLTILNIFFILIWKVLYFNNKRAYFFINIWNNIFIIYI